MDTSSGPPKVTPRLLFVAMTTLACTAGFVPGALFLERPLWILAILGISLVGSLIGLSNIRDLKARPVTVLERAGVFVSGLFLASISSMFVFVGYAIGLTLGVVSRWALSHSANPADWARGWAIVSGVLFLLGGVAMVSENLGKALFPKSGVGNAPLYPRLTWRSFLGWTSLVVALAIVLLFLAAGRHHPWAAAVLDLALIFGTATLNSEFEPPRLPIRERAIQAIRSLVQACGFRIIERLQANDPRVDKLISIFDLIAHRNGDVVAIQFKTTEEDQKAEDVPWTDATAIPGALWAVRRLEPQLNVSVHDTTAMIVLCGRGAEASLRKFAEEESVRIVELDRGTIQKVLDDNLAPDQLRQLAGQFLGLGAAPSPTGASGARA